MHWMQVKIKDLEDKPYQGEKARDFVVERLAGKITIKLNSGGTFALKTGKDWVVDPAGVFKILSDHLSGQVRELKVDGGKTELKTSFMPNRATENPINIVPRYILTFELGDIDALFEPIAQPNEPWKDEGVKQRLQVLGYLYTPLKHPGNNEAGKFNHSKACWEYYKRVHQADSDAAALEKLKQEIGGNLIAGAFPKSGGILPKSTLPAPKTFAAIRFPGGYCTTKSPVTGLRAGDHFFNNSTLSAVPDKYDFRIGDRRSDIEKLVFDENEMFGKFPLIAKVVADWGGGKIEPVPNVPVYFQLVPPDRLEPDNKFRAPELPDKMMDYSFDPGAFDAWQKDPPKLKRRVKISDEERDSDDKITKEAEYKDEEFTPAKEDWIENKNEASYIYKEAEKNCEERLQDLRNEVKKMEDNFNKWNAENIKQNKIRADLQREKDQFIKANLDPALAEKRSRAQAQTNEIESVTPKMMMRKQAEAAESQASKSKAASDAKPEDQALKEKYQKDAKTAQEKRAKYDTDAEVVKWRADLKQANDELDQAKKDYDEAEAKLTFPKENELKDAADKAIEASKKMGDPNAIKSKKETVNTILNNEGIRLLNNKNLRAGDETAQIRHQCIQFILNKAKEESNREAPIYRYLLANHGDNPVEHPSEIPNVGQKLFIDNLLAETEKKANPDDPRKLNAPKEYGGKSGLPAEGNVFETSSRKRFNDGYLDLGAILGAAKGAEAYAVKCSTNKNGFAGAVFMPSHCGGDTYKLRAFIDPFWLTLRRGRDHDSIKETGTMVVWRNIRINRYLQLKNPLTEFSEQLKETLATGKHAGGNPEYNKMRLDTDVHKLSLLPGDATEPKPYVPVDAGKISQTKMMYRPIQVNPTPLEKQFNWGYCELIADNAGIESLNREERIEAEALGLKALTKGWNHSKRIDWGRVIYSDAASPFLCNFLSFTQYSQSIKSRERLFFPSFDAKDEAEMTAIEKALQWFYEAMMEHYAGGGILPGITIVQIPRGDTWDLRACDVKTTVTSGYGTGARGFYISHTEGVYHDVFYIYPATSNAIHEIGHVLALAHQPPAGADIEEAHQKPIKEPFKCPDSEQCVCVMSYSGCYGDLCGKCVMTLRGWAQTHTNNLYSS
jgi:hypothetical protein